MQPDDVKAIRKALGMTQQAFADALGMSRKAVNEMEGGKAQIERRTVLAIRYIAEHPEAISHDVTDLARGTPLLEQMKAAIGDRFERHETRALLREGQTIFRK